MNEGLALGERRARLARLQSLYIRLLFCKTTCVRYAAAPREVLAEYGLPPEAQSSLPDPQDANFQAESASRRTNIYREVGEIFQRTLQVLERIATSGAPDAPQLGFPDFLSSDYFYNPGRSLPDPSGVGPGYENVSKFFFWVRDNYRVNTPQADLDLRTTLYSDFAMYLIGLQSRPVDAFYRRFKGAVMWPRQAGMALPVLVVSDKLMMFTVGDAAKVAELARIGIVDLDTVEPAEYRPAPNIM